MTREILFRGKRKDNGEWVCGCFGQHTGLDAHIIIKPYPDIQGELACLNFHEVIPETVGQYTGLTDENGKKIFEGDIILFEDEEDSEYYVVFWDEYGWAITKDYKDYQYGAWEDNLDRFVVAFSQIIGNIHDNIELLEA